MSEIPFDDEWNHDEYQGPPDGWYEFGTHAGWVNIPMLEFSEERDEAGMPRWERPPIQDDSSLRAALQDALHESEIRRKALFDALLKIEALKSEIEELKNPEMTCKVEINGPVDKDKVLEALGTCPRCRHALHRGFCPNMASDNDCSCTYAVAR